MKIVGIPNAARDGWRVFHLDGGAIAAEYELSAADETSPIRANLLPPRVAFRQSPAINLDTVVREMILDVIEDHASTSQPWVVVDEKDVLTYTIGDAIGSAP